MAYTVDSRADNPANRLRDALEEAEKLVISVKSHNIEEFLLLLDQIEAMFENVSGDRIDLRPEASRWEGILGRLHTNPDPFVTAAARAGGYDKLRAAHPPAESFWWHLDVEQAKRRRQSIQRFVKTVVSIVLIVTVGYWGLNTLFPPNPEAVILVDASSRVDRALMDGDVEGALEVILETQALLPEDPELMIWEGVLLETLGDDTGAAAAFDRAQVMLQDEPVYYWLQVGNKRLQLGDLDGAETAGTLALEANPFEAQALFLLGGVAEARGDVATAVDYFDQTFQMAEANNPQLAVIARVRMGQLLQRPAGDMFSDETSEPEPESAAATPVP